MIVYSIGYLMVGFIFFNGDSKAKVFKQYLWLLNDHYSVTNVNILKHLTLFLHTPLEICDKLF